MTRLRAARFGGHAYGGVSPVRRDQYECPPDDVTRSSGENGDGEAGARTAAGRNARISRHDECEERDHHRKYVAALRARADRKMNRKRGEELDAGEYRRERARATALRAGLRPPPTDPSQAEGSGDERHTQQRYW